MASRLPSRFLSGSIFFLSGSITRRSTSCEASCSALLVWNDASAALRPTATPASAGCCRVSAARRSGAGTCTPDQAENAAEPAAVALEVHAEERDDPVLQLFERLRHKSVVAVLALLADVHEAVVAQHLQVFGHSRLAEPQFVDDLADADLAGHRLPRG